MIAIIAAASVLLFVAAGNIMQDTQADSELTMDTELIGTSIEEQIYNYLTKPGRLAPYQAAAVMGNIYHESGMQPMRLEGTPSGVVTPAETVGTAPLGWGLVQWTPASKFIERQVLRSNANSVLVQLNFMWAQLNGLGPLPEMQAGRELRSAHNLEEAVIAFQGNMKGAPSPMGKQYYGFERPADQTGSVARRTAAAAQYLAQFGQR